MPIKNFKAISIFLTDLGLPSASLLLNLVVIPKHAEIPAGKRKFYATVLGTLSASLKIVRRVCVGDLASVCNLQSLGLDIDIRLSLAIFCWQFNYIISKQ